ncbi:hypothetical protein B0O99DRAFT_626050, partial [Bisporella sp. PMI_857]
MHKYSPELERSQSLRSFSTDSTRIDLELPPNEPTQKKQRSLSLWKFWGAIFTITLFGIIVWELFADTFLAKFRSTTSITWKHCGSSPQEALANECVYDFIAGAFVPKACYDAELEDEFLKLKDWRFYGDPYGQQELSIERIRLDGGTEPLFVTIEYHWVHCAYTWRKLHRSRIFGTPIDDHIASYEHTIHCGDGLVSQCDANKTTPESPFRHHYTTCI